MEDKDLFGSLDFTDIVPLIAIAALEGAPKHSNRPQTSGEGVVSGNDYLRELLNCDDTKRIYKVLRMSRGTFLSLCQLFRQRNLLKDTRNTGVEQQVAQFIWIINYSASFDATAERFRISKEPVSRHVSNQTSKVLANFTRYFHLVLQAVLELHSEVIKLPSEDTPLSSRIADDDKYKTYFTHCLGALDGTHIDVQVPSLDQPRYRNRKGHLSQNVLAVCNFDMEFVYILAGWEGSAHDTAVWRDAKTYRGFTTPQGRYWLGDAGYANTDTVLVPYRATRYHLKEQRNSGLKPENYKELFNLRHASLRNVIERIFGVVKRKYQILRTPSEYSIETQTRIILACCIFHNYVRAKEGPTADNWLDTEQEEREEEDIQPIVSLPEGVVSSRRMDQFREDIATRMWLDYQTELTRRGN